MKEIIVILSLSIICQLLYAQILTVPFSGTISDTACSGTVYDHAGTSSYNNSASGVLTIYPQTPGTFINLSFISFSTESCCDDLYIYDGTSTSAPLIGMWAGTTNPGNIFASNISGALTLRFSTDGSITYQGFEAIISCLTEIPLSDLIIQTPTVINPIIAAGGSINVDYTVKNQGGTIATSNYTGFYLSNDNSWDISDTYLSYQSITSLNAGSSILKSNTLTIPSSTPVGNYYILLYSDYTNVVSEEIESNNVNSIPIEVVSPIIDLYVTNVSLSSSSVAVGSNITAYGYVYNQGNSASPISSLGYYLSTDLIFDISDVYLSSINTSSINAGSNYYASKVLTIPNGTPSGNYYILYFADYPETLSESNENNNLNVASIMVIASGNDLSLLLSSANPTNIASGANSSVSYTVLNQSAQSTSTSIGFYISIDSIWDFSDTYLSYYSISSISANSFYSNSLSVTIPSSTTPGSYYILSYVDYTNSIIETNESNNVISIPVNIVAPVVDLLILSPVLSPATIASGNSVSVNCYIYNAGSTISSSCNVGYYLSTDNVFDVADSYLNYSSGGTLSAGLSSYKSSTLTIPVSTVPGNYYILYFADYSNSVIESNEINNVNYLEITVIAPIVDLTISSTSNPSGAVAGSNISVSCYIYNSGTNSASLSNVGYYLSIDNLFDINDIYLNNSSGGILTAGNSSIRSSTLTIPSSTPSGNYYILYYADYTNLVNESIETNNLSAELIIIGSGGGTTYTMPITGTINETTCSGTLYDDGGASLNYSNNSNGILTIHPDNVGNYISLNFFSFSTQSSSDYLNIYDGINTSYPLIGTYSGSVIPSTICATNANGALTLYFYSNSSTNYPGFSANISCVSSTPLPDLMILNGVSVTPTTVAQGSNIGNTCYISNNGNVSASTSNVGYYLSTDTIWDVSDTYLNYSSGSALNAGISSYKSSSSTIPVNTVPGNYFILFYADYSNLVSESVEINNIKWFPITIISSNIDLLINSQNLGSSTVTAGNSISVSCYINNQGNSTTLTSNVGYYLSSDQFWDVSDIYLNYSSGGSLTAGTSSYKSSTLIIPSSTTAGNYYILYYADYSNSVIESNETNNIQNLPISVISPFNDLYIINYYLSATSIASGASVNANCYIFNQGNISASSSNVGFYLSTDTIWDINDVYLNYQSGSTLSPNSYSSRARSLTIPSGTTAGNYFILFYADYTSLVLETNENNNIVFSEITIIIPTIDLLIFAPSVSNVNPVVGSTVSVSSTIFNAGNSQSTSSNIGYYLSIDTVFDISDIYLSNSTGTTLNSGTGTLKSTTLTIPSNTIPGNYYLLYFADYSNIISENNEINNLNYYQISVVASAVDLFILNPSLSQSNVAAGTSLNCNSYIYNQGNIAVNSSYIGYYLSTDTLWSTSDVYLTSNTGGSLSANTSSYRTNAITIPTSTTIGNYYILFFADYSNLVSENVETNNVNFLPITISPPFIDLNILSNSVSPLSLPPGSSISLSCYINNSGNTSSVSSNVGYYLSTNNSWDASDTYLSYSSGGTLSYGASSYRSSIPVIPTSVTPGIYYILYFADYSNNVVESIETNNVAYQQITVVAPTIDLIIQNQTVSPSSATSGQSISASCYILNQGNSTASISSVGFYLSTNLTYDVSDIYLNNQSGGALASGVSSLRSSTLTIPISTVPGTYYILYYADYLNAENEVNESNNVNYAVITIVPPNIDLIITTTNSSVSSIPGGIASVNCYIQNLGLTSSSSSNVGYYLSTDNLWDAGDTYLNYSTGSTLASGSSSYKSSSLTIPSSTIPGNYYILFFADYSNLVTETNETNNVNFASIIINAATFDLIITTPYSPASTIQGGIVSVNCYIQNQGTASSPTSNVGYYLSTNNVWDAGDTYLNYSSGSTLASGSSSYKSSSLTIPLSTIPGNYYILFYADYSNIVTETNETNNVNLAAITINTATFDLIITTPYSPASSIPGGIASVNCYIQNLGNASSTSSNVGYYLSTDNVWDAGDTYLSYSTGSTLASGSSSYRSSSLTIPSSTVTGNYYILFFADYSNIVSETNETNNVNFAAITINAATIDLIITTPNSPASSIPGGIASVNCYIQNLGTASSPTSNVGYYLSTDNVWDIGDTYLSYSTGNTLASGLSSYKSSSLTIPSSTVPGNYYILFYADYSNIVSETNETNNVNFDAITINAATYDLIITTPYSPVSTIQGGIVSVNCYIQNQGTASSPTSNVGYYLSTNNVWDASDTYLNYSAGSTLASGSSSYRSSSLTIPLSTVSGNYYILFYADYSNIVTEMNETNNVNFAAITINAATFDLIITTPYSPSSSIPGGIASVNCYIQNQGTASSPTSNVGYYLSTDNVWDAADIYLNYSTGSTLASGSSSYRSSSLTIPSSTVPGNYYILFYADYSNIVSETNETNNVNFAAITINAATIDLIITSPNSPASSIPGGITSVNCYIQNLGTASSPTSNVGYYLSTDNIWDVGDTYLSYSTGSTLASGSSSYKSSSLTIPSSTVPGNFYILFYADYSNIVSETNETNNVNFAAITINAATIDLIITSPNSPSSSIPGGIASVNCYIQNLGNASSTSSNVGYYLSTDNVWDAGDIYLINSTGGTLAAGSSSYRSSSLTIPSSTTPGNYYILLYADYSNIVTETNETNNVNFTAITINTATIDLIITTPNSTTSIIPGGVASVNCYIQNLGTASSPTSNVGYYLSIDNVWDAADIYLNNSTGGTLASGTSSYKSSSLTIPSSTVPGNFYILFYADYSSFVTESNEANNVNYANITIIQPNTDLIITNPYSPASVLSGGIVSVNCYIQNLGTTSSSSSNVGYYLSTDNIWDAGDIYLNYTGGGSLAAGSSSYRSSSLTIPSYTVPGNYYILFYADYSNIVSETNETNNVNYAAINIIQPNIDMIITNPYAPSSVLLGGVISVNCYIQNQGTINSSSSNVGYYLSTDNIWDAGDIYLNNSAGGSLAAGSSLYRSSSLTIPLSTVPGNYYILFFADYSYIVSETNETNNVNYAVINIIQPDIDMIITNPFTPPTTLPGGVISVNCYINNQGTVNSSSSNVGYYLSTDSIWDTSDTYLYYSTGGTLVSGSASYRSSSLPIPISTIPGNYYILFFADYSNIVNETNETNNVNYSFITILQSYIDLIITNPYSPSSSLSGSVISVHCYINNQGTVSSSSSNLGYYLSMDSVWDASDIYLNFTPGGTLASGVSSYRSTSLTIPVSTVSGNYYILFFSDYSEIISENNESNNVNYSAITIYEPFVDLSIIMPNTPISVNSGDTLSVNCYISNSGTINSSSGNVGYYLSTDTLWDVTDNFLDFSIGGVVSGGSTLYISKTVTIPVLTIPGNYYFLFFADYSNLEIESDETNNVMYIPLIVDSALVGFQYLGTNPIQVAIFPNPAKDNINLLIDNLPLNENLKIELLNITSQTIISEHHYKVTNKKLITKFDIKDVTEGIYFIKIISGDFISINKVIIK